MTSIEQDGAVLEGRVLDLLPGGETAVRTPKGVVLVRGALPGERIALRLTGKRRGAWRERVLRVLEAADVRRDPVCAHAGICGGCALQHATEEAQAHWKSAWVHQSFAPWWHADVHWQPCVPARGRRRRRVRWHVSRDADGCFLGFREAASHRVVRQRHCPAVAPELLAWRQRLEPLLPAQVCAVQATLLDDGVHLVLEGGDAPPSMPSLEGANLWWRGPDGCVPLGAVRSLHDRLPAGSAEVRLMIGPEAFVQGEADGNRELVAQVQQWLPDACRRIADLFCGVGNLSLPAAVATGADVVGAEVHPASVRDARGNAKRLGVSAHFMQADLFQHVDLAPFVAADVLILDPPRKGARQICQHISRLMPRAVILVSCDVASGRRDAALLHQAGYRLHAVRALDLFPGAGHVEAMSLWRLEG